MKYLLLTLLILSTSSAITTHAQNLFNDMFRPSVERGYIIDIGNSKDSVGSSIFEGGVAIDTNIGTGPQQRACEITNIIIQDQMSENNCTSVGGARLSYTYTQNNGNTSITNYHCVKNQPTTIQTTEENCTQKGIWNFGACKVAGREVHASNKEACEGNNASYGTRKNINESIEINQRDPLFVRIAKLLLRVTIALSVTFVLYSAIMYTLSFGNSAKTTSAQKRLLHIVIGIIIALSSVGIIYLIQSIVTQTLRY